MSYHSTDFARAVVALMESQLGRSLGNVDLKDAPESGEFWQAAWQEFETSFKLTCTAPPKPLVLTTPRNVAAAAAVLAGELERAGTSVPIGELEAELSKYMEYGVPLDQSVKTVRRHFGLPTQSSPSSAVQLPFGKYKGATLDAVPKAYLQWLAKDPDPKDTFVVPPRIRDEARRLL